MVVHHDDSGPSEGSDRVLAQVVENEHRAGLSTADRVGAYRQLAAFGLSATQIACRSATRKTDVDHALKVAGSDLAVAATVRYDLGRRPGCPNDRNRPRSRRGCRSGRPRRARSG